MNTLVTVIALSSSVDSETMAVPETCPECTSANIGTDWGRGELLCNDCGLVLQENIADTTAPIPTEKEARPISPRKDAKGIPLRASGRKLEWKIQKQAGREYYSKTTDLERQVESRVKSKIQRDKKDPFDPFKEFSKLLKDLLKAKVKYLRSTPEKEHLFAPPGRPDNVLSVAVATEVLRRRLRGEHATPKATANILFPDDPDIDYERLRKFATKDLKEMMKIPSIRARLKEQKQRRKNSPAKIEIFRRELAARLIVVRLEFSEFPNQTPLDTLLDSGPAGPEVVGILNDNVPENTDAMPSLVMELIYQSQSLQKKKIPRGRLVEVAGHPGLRCESKRVEAKRLMDYFNGV